ncbi:MAG: hypothetical protein QXS93_02230 [Candidatus Micrarchaeia archaeon]
MSYSHKKDTDAIKRKLRQMRDKAQKDLERLKVPPDVIYHNQQLFYTIAASLNGITKAARADINPTDLLWLSLYHENLSYSALPSEIKETIGGLFRRFIELKHIDMSKKEVWTPYNNLVDECPALAVFRTIDLAHFPMDYNTLVRSFLFKKDTVEYAVRNIAESMLYVYVPFADILGILDVYSSLLDKSTSILYPDLYRGVYAKLKELQDENEHILKNFGNRLEYDILEAEMEDIHFANFSDNSLIKGRIKTTGSTVLKLIRKNYPIEKMMEFEDLVAFTVLTETEQDAYKFVEFLKNKYKIPEGHFDDYIRSPRGQTQYQSLHQGVPFEVERFGEKKIRFIEVQIRTPEMQEKCERGDQAHALFKQRKIDKEKLLLMLQYSTTLRNASTEEVQMLALNLRSERITVLATVTPDSEVMIVDLPENSCVYDLICKVSDPFYEHKVVSATTNRMFSPYESLIPGAGYFIMKTGERMRSSEIRRIIPICSLETRMQLQWMLENKKK